MKAYILAFIVCLSAPLTVFAQSEAPDTIGLRCDSLPKISISVVLSNATA